MVVVDKIQPHLPNLVIHQIQSLLPTKSALRMSFLSKQWEGVWPLSPVIDFDQGGTHTDDEDNIKFINILERYLEFCLKDKQLLDKFRLHMRYHGEGRTVTVVDIWVRFAVMRSIKELDISLGSIWPDYYYLSLENLGGKSITTLNLEYVAIDKISNELSLPSLKYVSLKTVRMDYSVIHRLISECPSMEYLSLTSCSLIDRGKMSLATLFLYTSSSYNNLKTLEVRDCMFSYIRVTGINLESFTLDSRYRHLKRVALCG
ncbi:putative F-box/LRR-repeat protein At4g15060 [Rosa chinensis]|uniref:putative F-box/LRR-repeat protein At4g15060 n=1 Tax=Rosa chinensis TaxID=74649 RepID=UPI000D08A5CC|nr:putative F-box/LRR-repeat protein At4g15060 [Rosa chinensis]